MTVDLGPDGVTPVVDIHCHVRVPECDALVASRDPREREPFNHFGGASSDYNRQHFGDIEPQLTSPEVRIRDMDTMGVDVQALSVAPPQYYYWTEPDLGARLATMQNERLAEMVAEHPDRFAGLGTVPLQDVERSIRELDRVAELGFRGLEVCTNVGGLDYDDPRFGPFFAKVQELDLLLVLHPHGFTQGQRLSDYYLVNVVGNPLESTLAAARLIFGGVLEAHPGLRVCIVHGGGYLPLSVSRMDHAFHVRPECREHISRPPSSYFDQLWFDTVVFDTMTLDDLVDRVGADHVLLGTDYPYDMGETDPKGLVRTLRSLTGAERSAILGGTAARLLKLTAREVEPIGQPSGR